MHLPETADLSPPPETSGVDMIHAALWGWLTPRRCAQRTWKGALWRAWLWHAAVSLITFLFLTLFISMMDREDPFWLLGEMVEELEGEPVEFLATTGISIAVYQGIVVLLAFAVMPWGCQDEPLRKSFGNAFRQTWLHTTHLAVVIIFLMILIRVGVQWQEAYTDRYGHQWGYSERAREAFTRYVHARAPAPPATRDPYDAERVAYDEAMAFRDQSEYVPPPGWDKEASRVRMRASRIYERRKPFLLHYSPLLIAVMAALSAVWFIWSLLRAVATPRPVIPPLTRDPQCEFCGYNLIATPLDSRCPECGEPVVNSLGKHVRAEAPWGKGGAFNIFRTWPMLAWQAVWHPSAFGRTIPARTPLFGHGIVLALHMTILFVGMMTTILWLAHLDRTRNVDTDMFFYYSRIHEWTQITFSVGLSVLLTLGLIGLWAWLVTCSTRKAVTNATSAASSSS